MGFAIGLNDLTLAVQHDRRIVISVIRIILNLFTHSENHPDLVFLRKFLHSFYKWSI